MNIPPTHSPAGDLRAELDRLDRELEVLRTRLEDEQGALHEAQARCRALDQRLHEQEPSGSVRRVPRTSRIESPRLNSRTAHVGLRAIAGGATALPRPRAVLVEDVDVDEGPDAA